MGSGESHQKFDIARAVDAARHYAASTGIQCRALDESGLALSHPGQNGSVITTRDESGSYPCAVCDAYRRITGNAVACAQAHLYGSFQSLRFGGRYTYFCPLALTHFAAPILADGAMVGSFVAGPVLLIDPDEYLAAEMGEQHGLSKPQVREMETAVRAVSQVGPERAHALGEQLLYTASWVSGINVREIVEEEQRISQEAEVSSYIHHLKTMGGDVEDRGYPSDKERELLSMIRHGDRDQAQALLAELFGELRVMTGDDLRTMRARVLELTVLLSRAAVDGGADAESVFGVNFRALEEIQTFTSVEQLSTWVSRMTTRFVQFVFDVNVAGQRDVILKSIQYMRKHLGERLGLEEVAGEVRLSPAYFSRVFKKEVGQSFTSYLNGIRVERAKVLLRATRRTIIDIAMEVGLSDQSHFSRVFRKHTSMSPARYRQSNPGLPTETHEIHR